MDLAVILCSDWRPQLPTRVLLVEDDPRLSATRRRGLAEAGLGVEVASDGREGLAAAGATAFDVVVLDVMLPGMNGFTVCRELRKRLCRLARPARQL